MVNTYSESPYLVVIYISPKPHSIWKITYIINHSQIYSHPYTNLHLLHLPPPHQNKSHHGTKPPPPNKTIQNQQTNRSNRSAKGTVYLAASGSPLMPSLFKSVMALVAFIGTPPHRPPSNVARPRDDISWQVIGRGYGQPPFVEGEVIYKPAMFHSYVMLDYQRVNQGKG